MDYEKNIARWIEGFTKDQFDEFIKVFIKIYWKIDLVSIVDGKGDGGIDVKIFEGKRNKKIPLQITIDKNVYTKLERDLVKINALIENYDYSENFYFYYSKGASEAKVIELKDKARRDYSINLEIFDNKLIASYLSTPEYLLARNKLTEFLGQIYNEEQIYDEKDKLYSDFLSYGNQSQELKEKFINSFVLNELFKSENNSLSRVEIQNKIFVEFNISDDKQYCNRLIDGLLTFHKVVVDDNFKIKLTNDEIQKIKVIREDSNLLEREFLTKLQDIINKNDTSADVKGVIDKLNNIYEEVGEVDIKEISESIETVEQVRSSIRELYNYIDKSFKIKSEASAFIVDVFNLCGENNFIHKVSAGKLFKKLIDNSEFSAYSKRMKKEVFIDTPVLIYLLMASREQDLEYDNNKFKIARDLFNLIQNDTQTALYSTTDLYILELADYIKSTIKLIPIEKLGVFKSLGGSKNEFLNLYFKAKEDGFFQGGFSDYIESFGISISQVLKNDRYLEQYLIKHFKNNFIQVDEVYHYENDYKSKENYKYYDKIERTLFEVYEDKNVSRKLRSVKFDCLLFMHIYFIEEELIDPTILTWDNTFNEFRKKFQPQNPNLRYWHLFRPGKFLDHISLIKFKINGSSISNEILSLIETDFEVVEGVKKLADILNSIIDLKSETGTKLTIGLAKIRDTYVYKINKNQSLEVELIEMQPVDEIVSNLVFYYTSNKGEFSFEDFTIALKDENIIKELLKILNKESDYYLVNGNLSEKYKSNVDNLIKEFKEKE